MRYKQSPTNPAVPLVQVSRTCPQFRYVPVRRIGQKDFHETPGRIGTGDKSEDFDFAARSSSVYIHLPQAPRWAEGVARDSWANSVWTARILAVEASQRGIGEACRGARCREAYRESSRIASLITRISLTCFENERNK